MNAKCIIKQTAGEEYAPARDVTRIGDTIIKGALEAAYLYLGESEAAEEPLTKYALGLSEMVNTARAASTPEFNEKLIKALDIGKDYPDAERAFAIAVTRIFLTRFYTGLREAPKPEVVSKNDWRDALQLPAIVSMLPEEERKKILTLIKNRMSTASRTALLDIPAPGEEGEATEAEIESRDWKLYQSVLKASYTHGVTTEQWLKNCHEKWGTKT